MEKDIIQSFLSQTFPLIKSLVLDLPKLFLEPITYFYSKPFDEKNSLQQREFSKSQVASLIACSFLSLLSIPLKASYAFRYCNMMPSFWHNPLRPKNIIAYFDSFIHVSKEPIILYRHQVDVKKIQIICERNKNEIEWTKFEWAPSMCGIEECTEKIQVDFASPLVGGQVLGGGIAQEEFMFLCMPECLVSTFICERMQDNEAIIIVNCEKTDNNKQKGNSKKNLRVLTAINADENQIMTPERLLRDLVKAYAGFSIGNDKLNQSYSSIATGNWGCGVFQGRVEINLVLQWIAASISKRNVYYCAYDGSTVQLQKLVAFIQTHIKTIPHLWEHLLEYCKVGQHGKTSFYEYLSKIQWLTPL